ncbi:rRNA methyltransferase [Treponema primitia]|uniref:small ribosomal subunit Rsm22 family protein n=1 Tax=Treponema primitia TaxID=88058 RepID=UPI003980D585
METLFPPLSVEIRRQVDSIPALVDQVLPIPKRFRSGLSRDVAELSRLLTSGRGERNDSYLNEAPLLSAYLRYFLPWNVYRLARLFPSLPLPLAAGDALTDLGSGPLTLPIALWISRPDLRQLPLEFRCLDRSGPALEAGKKIFTALTSSNTAANTSCPWTIKTIRASLGEPVRFSKAKLLTAVNLFNELFWKLPGVSALASFTEKQARILSPLTLESGSILALEPGVPRCGEFISLLRASLSAKGRLPLSPCPHTGPCPLPGIPAASRSEKADTKWCHFAFTTTDAPAALHRLSEAAGIPKERAVLSFLLAGPVNAALAPASEPAPQDSLPVRVISDPFPLTGEGKRNGPAALHGRYGCSVRGLVLVSGKRDGVETLESGTQVTLTATTPEKRDGKSGALVLGLSSSLSLASPGFIDII